MNDMKYAAVMDAPATVEKLDEVMAEGDSPEVMEITMESQEEIMILPENVNPKLVDELTVLDAGEHDITDEIEQMDTFNAYQREIFAEMRGYNSDQF